MLHESTIDELKEESARNLTADAPMPAFYRLLKAEAAARMHTQEVSTCRGTTNQDQSTGGRVVSTSTTTTETGVTDPTGLLERQQKFEHNPLEKANVVRKLWKKLCTPDSIQQSCGAKLPINTAHGRDPPMSPLEFYWVRDGMLFLEIQEPNVLNEWQGAWRCTFPGCKHLAYAPKKDANKNRGLYPDGWSPFNGVGNPAHLIQHAEKGHYKSTKCNTVHWNAMKAWDGSQGDVEECAPKTPPPYVVLLKNADADEGQRVVYAEEERAPAAPPGMTTPASVSRGAAQTARPTTGATPGQPPSTGSSVRSKRLKRLCPTCPDKTLVLLRSEEEDAYWFCSHCKNMTRQEEDVVDDEDGEGEEELEGPEGVEDDGEGEEELEGEEGVEDEAENSE